MAYRHSTLEEKKAAAKRVLDHEIVPAASKDCVLKAIADLEK